jgi:regulator of CtrA degradation
MTEHPQFDKFIVRTYDETFSLLEEARDYSTFNWTVDVRRSLPDSDATAINRELLRLTTRLGEMLAWLMVHKAVAPGKITLEQALADQYRLSQKELCLKDGRTRGVKWPQRLNVMLERSRELYSRVLKMDQMAARL